MERVPDPYDSFDFYDRKETREERLREREEYEDIKADSDWAERLDTSFWWRW